MGNCLLGGIGGGEESEEAIKVVTWNGGVMEFREPIAVELITKEFPGHGVFINMSSRIELMMWNLIEPLAHHHVLRAGEEYHLLPLQQQQQQLVISSGAAGHVRSSSFPSAAASAQTWSVAAAPYRMSFDSHRHGSMLLKRTHSNASTDTHGHPLSSCRRSAKRKVIATSSGNNLEGAAGFWKVKLVISPQNLLHILSEECRTQELIENVRTVAKCATTILGA